MDTRLARALLSSVTFIIAGCGDDPKPPPHAAGSAGIAGSAGDGGFAGDSGGSGGDAAGDGGFAGDSGGSGGDAAGDGGFAGHAGSGKAGAGGSAGGGGAGVAGEAGNAGAAGTGGAPRECDAEPDGDCPCLKVSPDGDDVLAAASYGATPFQSVGAAIDYADANRSVAVDVCVAGGSDCDARAAYPGPSDVDFAMRDGISVYGSYESTAWARCQDTTTDLLPATVTGVLFGAAVQTPTTLSGSASSHPWSPGRPA